MKVSSATGRGAARVPRRPGKVIRMPDPRRARRRRTFGIGGVIIAVVCAGALAARVYLFPAPPTASAPVATLDAEESNLLRMANEARARAGLAPLKISNRLMAAARIHSADMAARGYAGHDSPAGDTPADRVHRFGLSYEEIAENIYAADDGAELATLPARALAAWLADPAHRANLLSARFRATAIAISRAPDGAWYVTQDFMR